MPEKITAPEKEFSMSLFYKQNREINLKLKEQKLFYFSDIEKDYENVIRKWFVANEELLPIRNHLLDAITARKVFKSMDFLVLAFALEGYFSRFRKKDTNLKVAIIELLDEFKNVRYIRNINIMTEQVNDSRNYYAHLFDKNKKEHVLFGYDLYELAEKLKLLLICCLLKEIGLDDGMIDKSIAESGLK